MKVLLTGGGGFIGRNLRAALSGRYALFAPSSRELDLLDPHAVEAYLKEHRFDAVVHAATWNATRTSQRDRSLVLENNLRMFFNLARSPKLYGRLINLGSGAEYDRSRPLIRASESDFDRHVPSDAYGFSKYLIRKYCERMPDFANLTLFGVFGPHEDWRIRFISNACCHALAGMAIQVRRDALFDYLHVDELAPIVAWFLENRPRHRAYNVCTGTPIRLVQLAELVREVAGGSVPVEVLNLGEGPAYSGDVSRLEAEAGPLQFGDRRRYVESLYRWYEGKRNEINREALLARAWNG